MLFIRHQEHLSVMLLEHLGDTRGHWQAGVKFVPATGTLVLRSAQELLL